MITIAIKRTSYIVLVCDKIFIPDMWYTTANPITRHPIVIPLRAWFINAAKAIRKDISSGKGCGKIGIKDRPKTIPINVTINVNTLSDFCLSARSISSFFLCFLLLYQARGWKMAKLRRDFKADQCKTLICLTALKACCGEY